ncbi:hypothetical protein STBA_37410 [Streptomyces sp. MP131-18]|nr:hypothetical protein STBA_37410 [Streptomyces sp. MP131-18]
MGDRPAPRTLAVQASPAPTVPAMNVPAVAAYRSG